ncbi:MAG: cell division protein CrgA [Acidimicrobiales bacterium]|jgi:hypothetical protein|nr:hypothetical protein [Acidimicrobiaceae bacterium]
MARPKKTSRLTPKGTRPEGFVTEESLSGDMPPSPPWFGWLILSFLLAGVAVIFSNYMSWLPGSPSSSWILGGLGFVLVGILLATRWR